MSSQPKITQVFDGTGRSYHDENRGYHYEGNTVVVPSARAGRTQGTNILGMTPEAKWPVVRDPLINNIDMDKCEVDSDKLPAMAAAGVQRLIDLQMPIDPSLRDVIKQAARPTNATMTFVPDQPTEPMNQPIQQLPVSMQQQGVIVPPPAPRPAQPVAVPPSEVFRPKVRFEIEVMDRVRLPAACHSLEAFLPSESEPGRPPSLLMAWDTRAEEQGFSPPPRLQASGDNPLHVVIRVQNLVLYCTHVGMTFSHGTTDMVLFLLDVEQSNLYPPAPQNPTQIHENMG